MLDPAFLRDNLTALRAALEARGADLSAQLEDLAALEAQRRRLLPELESLKREQNAAADEVGRAKREGQDTAPIQQANRERAQLIKQKGLELDDVEQKRSRGMLLIPNLPHESVPAGKSAADNVEVRRSGTPRSFDFAPQAHWDLGPALGIIDFERGTKIAGARFTVLIGAGARLARALIKGRWRRIESVEAISTGGATLRRQEDGSILAGRERPEKDAYVVIGRTGLARVTAVRLEVSADPSLPKSGPGRAENGNLHLSEFKAYVDEGGANRPIALRNPTADFDQEGWPIAHAVDGNAETAWGVHPQEGRSHAAVFELAEPIETGGGAKLTFLLEQSHGRGHTIGRFRISVSDALAPVRAVKLPDAVMAALATPAGSRSDGQRAALAGYVLAEETARALGALPPQQKVYAIASDFAPQGNFKPARTPRAVEVLRRGDVRQPMGPAAPLGALSCVAGLASRFDLADPRDEAARRAALARWVAARENVLTWRSIVNRVWHYHFGRGIVETPNDFGRMGAVPTHPELLDWLAVTFRDDLGGSLKRLHRLIVTSATYRQVSTHDPARATVDGENTLLWRMNRARLDAESVRDAVLAMSGRLDLTMGGPAQKQFVESKGVHETPNADYDAFDVDSPAARRRSVYHFVFRTVPDPLMRAMDCPDASQLAPRRESSVTALQALAMLNDRVIVRQSQHIADRLAGAERDAKRQVRGLYVLALGRPPTDDEVEAVTAYAAKHGLANAARVLLNSNEFMFVE